MAQLKISPSVPVINNVGLLGLGYRQSGDWTITPDPAMTVCKNVRFLQHEE